MRNNNYLSTVLVQVNQEYLIINNEKITIPNLTFVDEMFPRGSNGLVFQSNDSLLHRQVALKIWIQDPRDNRTRPEQALAEAAKLAQLNHGNIAQIYSCGSLPNGQIYSIMEYINGITLRARFKKGNPDFFERFRIWQQIDEALTYSYKLGIYHGDPHAGNILVIGDSVKIIDFGTSIFARKSSSKRRETRILIDLALKIFREYEPTLNEIIEVDLNKIDPDRALPILSQWVHILFGWRNIFSKNNSEDLLIVDVAYFTSDIIIVPFFSIDCLVRLLEKQGCSSRVQNEFIARCLIWADFFLNKPVDSQSGVMTAPHPFLVSLNLQKNMELLKNILPKLREIYNIKGSLE